MRTDWSRLVEYLQDLHVGEQRRISIEELRRIVRTDELPPSVSRITLWDPLMGRAGGLQKALLESRCIPAAFEWTGNQNERPRLKTITLLRWGNGIVLSD